MKAELKRFIDFRKPEQHAEGFIQARYDHCRERLADRFNIDMSYEEWEQLNYDLFMEGQPGNKTQWVDTGDSTQCGIYRVEIGTLPALVAYSETAYLMLTVFPKHDVRLRHVLSGTFQTKAQSDSELAFRDHRRELAADFARGFNPSFPMKRPALSTVRAPNLAFAEALQGFTPPEREEPTPTPTLDDTACEVAAMFARLEAALESDDEGLAEIEEEERAIEALQAKVAAMRADLARKLADDPLREQTRIMAQTAFDRFREGAIDAAAAQRIIEGLGMTIGCRIAVGSLDDTAPYGRMKSGRARLRPLMSPEERSRVAVERSAKIHGKVAA